MSEEIFVYTGENVWLRSDLEDSARETNDTIDIDQFPVVERVGTVALPCRRDPDYPDDDDVFVEVTPTTEPVVLLTNSGEECVELAGISPLRLDGSTWDIWAPAGTDYRYNLTEMVADLLSAMSPTDAAPTQTTTEKP